MDNRDLGKIEHSPIKTNVQIKESKQPIKTPGCMSFLVWSSIIIVVLILIALRNEDEKKTVTQSITNTKVEQARKNLDPTTQRLISFNVTPHESVVRYGQQLKYSLILKNEGDHTINGANISVDGDWYKYSNISLSENAKLENGILSDKIIYSDKIEPQQQVTIEFTGTVNDGTEIDPAGFICQFIPTTTFDNRKFVGDVDKQTLQVYILPEKQGAENVNVSVSEAKRELANYTPAMIDFNLETKINTLSSGEKAELVLNIENKGDRPIEGLYMYASNDFSYLENLQVSSGQIEPGLLTQTIKIENVINPNTSMTLTITGTLNKITKEKLKLTVSPGRSVNGEEVIVLGDSEKKK
ncbi:hypothetical protein PM3016_5481 [Paenibacillus mucilaginosus 3016]|uniref:DUF11 domain-containing protein n=1 Tax=Paenibacillus mucilaginosus 3016 TaxID=1116391 RepID=H6NG54_9BACL|nr:hypothetical protein [Paenibacillus mucilaginosus]AFC32181.1 hypothetical protein PM3016_5481 [Paenibacillus mucilaginosus 3016]